MKPLPSALTPVAIAAAPAYPTSLSGPIVTGTYARTNAPAGRS